MGYHSPTVYHNGNGYTDIAGGNITADYVYRSAEGWYKKSEDEYKKLIAAYNVAKNAGKDVTGLPNRVYVKMDDWKAKADAKMKILDMDIYKARKNWGYAQDFYKALTSKDGHHPDHDTWNTSCNLGSSRKQKSCRDNAGLIMKKHADEIRKYRNNLKDFTSDRLVTLRKKMEGEGGFFGKLLSRWNSVMLAPMRGVVMFMIKSNFLGLGTKLDITKRKYSAKWNRIELAWLKMGGQRDKLKANVSAGKDKEPIDKLNELKLLFNGGKAIDTKTSFSGETVFANFKGDPPVFPYNIGETTKSTKSTNFVNADNGDDTGEDVTPDTQIDPQVVQAGVDMITKLGNDAKAADTGKSKWKPAAYGLVTAGCTAAGGMLGSSVPAIGTAVGGTIGGAAAGLLNLIISLMPDSFSKEDTKGTPIDDKSYTDPNGGGDPNDANIFAKIPTWAYVAAAGTTVIGGTLLVFRKAIFGGK